ncbi:hypothetical protein SBA2_10127 [Acidobacteriia bacterium SbA2]|nr:hypothetical protein SBA2_10127 [Acidobacteriia bacterium SbA2]
MKNTLSPSGERVARDGAFISQRGSGEGVYSPLSWQSADGHPETTKCQSERSEESRSASGRPPQKDQGEIPRFARNDSTFQRSEGSL